MYLRTVLRSTPVRLAMADTGRPWRCSSRIMTTSPSRTTSAASTKEAIITPAAARHTGRAVARQSGEISTGTFGENSPGSDTSLIGRGASVIGVEHRGCARRDAITLPIGPSTIASKAGTTLISPASLPVRKCDTISPVAASMARELAPLPGHAAMLLGLPLANPNTCRPVLASTT